MKHNTLRTAASLAACLLSAVIVICGCQKDKLDPAKAASAAVTEGDFELTVAVSYGPSTNTKTTITQSSTILPVKWKTGDKLYVVGATDGYLGSLTQTGDLSGDPVGRTAYFKGNVKGWSEAQVLHIYYLGDAPTIDTDNNTFSFDISSQEGTLAWIASNGHIAHGATASLAPGTQTIATAASPLTMSNMNAVILYDLSAWTSGVEISGTYNKATLDLKTGAFKSDGYTTGDIALASDKCTATTYVTFIPDNKALTFTDGTATTPTKANNIEAGRFYSNAGAAIVIKKIEHLPGAFSVSATKKVNFSTGNLRYTSGKWDFYEEQYECASSIESSVISLHTWSYGSWSTTWNTEGYSSTNSFTDWGTQVGDGTTWFTLSNDEWRYLVSSRTNASNLAKHNVTVCGKTNCLVIAPDNWDTTSCPLQETYDESSTPLTWSQAEEEGLVCLPAGGIRKGSGVYEGVYPGNVGAYWSSTAYPTKWTNKYFFRFDTTKHNADECTGGFVGMSVRLVKDAPLPTPTDLGSTANCYIVPEAGYYKFKATQGNSITAISGIQSVKVLWESFGTSTAPNVGDLIRSDVSYSENYIYFKASNKKGNAVIAAYDGANGTGNILWSWHIWCTDQPAQQAYNNAAGTMMDRNLGATSATKGDVGALGLLYQWGRKDPFLNSSAINSNTVAQSTLNWPTPEESSSTVGTISYVHKHPTTFVTCNSGNYDWYYTGTTSTDNTRWQSSKTIYDPCPQGWHVPTGGVNGIWSRAFNTTAEWTTASNWDGTNKGMDFGKTDKKLVGTGSDQCWYPAEGYRTYQNGELDSVGTIGFLWSCTPTSDYNAYRIAYNNSCTVVPLYENRRAVGCSVRCVKE